MAEVSRALFLFLFTAFGQSTRVHSAEGAGAAPARGSLVQVRMGWRECWASGEFIH